MKGIFRKEMAVLIGASAMVLQCAMPAPPTGGERDKQPPVIQKSSIPQASTQFNGQSMSWTFDEFVVLNSPRLNMRCNPPLPGDVEYALKGKKFTVQWSGDMMPNTTYNLQWGNTIKDLHEGNVLSGISWVWSTGETLDSGHIHSVWHDALTGAPVKELAVNLYPLGSGDSCVFDQPVYSSRTDDSGHASFHYVKPGEYLIRSFQDPDGNNTLSVGEKTAIGSGFAETGQSVVLPFAQSPMPLDSILDWSPGHADSSGTMQLSVLNMGNWTRVVRLKQKELRYAQWILAPQSSIDSTLAGLPPGSYQLESWTVISGQPDSLQLGNYWEHRPADQRMLWPDPIEIKAGWEHQVDWSL